MFEPKKALEYLGFNPEEFKTEEEFKSKFDSVFVKQSNINEDTPVVKSLLGRIYGSLENQIKKVAKENEIEVDFDTDEFKDKKISDKLKHTFTKFNEVKGATIKELESKVGLGNDEKVKEWETKYNKAAQKAKDFESLLNSTKSEFEQSQQKWQSQIKDTKLNVLTKDAFSKVKLKNDISEFEKKGYYSTIKEKYQFDIDEQENLIVKNAKGERIPSAKTTGTFKTIDEILEEEAVAGNLYKMNVDGGKPKQQINFGTSNKNEDTKPVRKIAPRLG